MTLIFFFDTYSYDKIVIERTNIGISNIIYFTFYIQPPNKNQILIVIKNFRVKSDQRFKSK